MTGAVITLDHTFSKGFYLGADPALTDGSLLLIEPARDSLTEVGTTLTNYASEQLEALLGTTPAALELSQAWNGKGKFEKTDKGGLHGITTTGAMGQAETARLNLPDDINENIRVTNSTDSYGLFVQGRITQNPAGMDSEYAGTNSTIVLAGLLSRLGVRQERSTGGVGVHPLPAASGYLGGGVIGYTKDAWTPFLAGAAASNFGSFIGETQNMPIWGGRTSTYGTGAWGSWILYRLHLVNLTKAGKTYAEMLALEQAIYTKRFAEGGKYYGDTWTDPATLEFA